MNIVKSVLKELNSFEVNELSRILEALEYQALYINGLSKATSIGAYANAEAFEIYESETYDHNVDEWIDNIEIEVEIGEQGENSTTISRKCYIISRKVVGNKNLSLKEKLEVVK